MAAVPSSPGCNFTDKRGEKERWQAGTHAGREAGKQAKNELEGLCKAFSWDGGQGVGKESHPKRSSEEVKTLIIAIIIIVIDRERTRRGADEDRVQTKPPEQYKGLGS